MSHRDDVRAVRAKDVVDRVGKSLQDLASDSFGTHGRRSVGMFTEEIGAALKLGEEAIGGVSPRFGAVIAGRGAQV